jgi:hypothetical protein
MHFKIQPLVIFWKTVVTHQFRIFRLLVVDIAMKHLILREEHGLFVSDIKVPRRIVDLWEHKRRWRNLCEELYTLNTSVAEHTHLPLCCVIIRL